MALERSCEVAFDDVCRQLAYHAAGDTSLFDVVVLAYSLLRCVAYLPYISPHLPTSPHISPYLLISPHISPYLPISPHISRHLPTSPRSYVHVSDALRSYVSPSRLAAAAADPTGARQAPQRGVS